MSGCERILYVDDDDMVRRAFVRTLQRIGLASVDTADGRAGAVALAGEHEYAVVATDYVMPDVNGLALVDELRAMQPNSTYMVVSGQCDLELALTAINEHSVTNVLTKPWNAEDLNIRLRRGIEAYWERQARSEVERSMVEASRNLEQQKQRLDQALACNETMMAGVLLNALDLRTRETRAHCRRVAAYAQVIAEAMGLKGHALVSLQHGALLHDIGKIGVPDAILMKPDALNPEEWQVMREHSAMGARVLDGFAGLEAARDLVLQHHERWDGSGYPRRLAGEQILLEARILAVADTVDAMMSDRPYRRGLPLTVAESELAACAGKQFDPAVVEAFTRVDRGVWQQIRDEFPDEPELALVPKDLAA